jgi:outer membrane protein TolC
MTRPVRATESPTVLPSFGDPSSPVDLSGAVTLQNCVGLALGRNFTVRIKQFTVFEAVDSVDVQKAAFEPTFNFNANKQVVQEATGELTQFGVIPYSSVDTASFSVDDTLITGGTLVAGYSLVRSDNNPSLPPNPSFGDAAAPPGGGHRLQQGRDREGKARGQDL